MDFRTRIFKTLDITELFFLHHVKFYSLVGVKFNMVLEHLLKPECAVLCDILVPLKINQIEKFNKLVIKNSNEK